MTDEQSNKAEKRKIARSIELADLRDAFSTPAARRVLWRLLGECGCYRESFATNALMMANAEGKRYIGLFLISELHDANPDLYLQMQKEAMTKEESNA